MGKVGAWLCLGAALAITMVMCAVMLVLYSETVRGDLVTTDGASYKIVDKTFETNLTIEDTITGERHKLKVTESVFDAFVVDDIFIATHSDARKILFIMKRVDEYWTRIAVIGGVETCMDSVSVYYYR